jgi:hypothetical protein
MSKRPILYLRSFHSPDAGQVFGKLVCPAVYRWTSITGLVHRTQPSTSLQRTVPFLWRTNFRSVPDEAWHAFIEREVPRALGVIIDLSEQSDSLQWELEVARRYHAQERVLILRRGDARGPDHVGSQLIHYDLSDRGAPLARERIQAWVRGLVAPLMDRAPLMIPTRLPRWQVPVWAILYVIIGVPMVLSVYALTNYMSRTQAHSDGLREMQAKALAEKAGFTGEPIHRNRQRGERREPGSTRNPEPASTRRESGTRADPKCLAGDPLCGF